MVECYPPRKGAGRHYPRLQYLLRMRKTLSLCSKSSKGKNWIPIISFILAIFSAAQQLLVHMVWYHTSAFERLIHFRKKRQQIGILWSKYPPLMRPIKLVPKTFLCILLMVASPQVAASPCTQRRKPALSTRCSEQPWRSQLLPCWGENLSASTSEGPALSGLPTVIGKRCLEVKQGHKFRRSWIFL